MNEDARDEGRRSRGAQDVRPATAPRTDPADGRTSDVALLEAFVDLARSGAAGADPVELTTALCERIVTVLPVAAAGVMMVDAGGALRVLGSSSVAAHLLDLLQVQDDAGPCRDCCRDGGAVTDVVLAAEGPWPRFAAAVRAEGFGAVHALPLTARGHVLGALNLFAERGLAAPELRVAQALADAATLALLQADPDEDALVVARRLHVAVVAHATVQQAVGVLRVRLDLSADGALLRLREVAAATGVRLVDVAAVATGGADVGGVAALLQRG